jgi:hypothetical protein
MKIKSSRFDDWTYWLLFYNYTHEITSSTIQLPSQFSSVDGFSHHSSTAFDSVLLLCESQSHTAMYDQSCLV